MRILKKQLWPFRVDISLSRDCDTHMIEQWLCKEYGAFKSCWNVVYGYQQAHFYFKNHQDASWFSLKWSQ